MFFYQFNKIFHTRAATLNLKQKIGLVYFADNKNTKFLGKTTKNRETNREI